MGIVLPAMPVGNANAKSGDDNKLDWMNIELETLGKEYSALLLKHLASLEASEKTKQAFEAPFKSACEVAAGHQMVFSYKKNRAGEWEVRVAEAPMREGKAKVSFADLAKKKK